MTTSGQAAVSLGHIATTNKEVASVLILRFYR